MPASPPTIDLDSLKDQILASYREGQNYQEIAFQFSVSERTIKRRLQSWGIRKRAPPVKAEDATMRSHVALYFIGNLTDDEIVFALQQQGWRVNKRTVARIRKSQGLRRRFSAFERQVAVDALWNVIAKELDSGSIEGYGRRLLQVHFR